MNASLADSRTSDVKPSQRPPPIHLLTLTTLFPNSRRPRHGIFVANRLRRLCADGRADATVIAALPWFPGAYRDTTAVEERERTMGFDVLHPRYLNVPGIGMRIQPDSLARALLAEFNRRDLSATGFDAIDAHYFYPDGVAAARVADTLGLPLTITARGSDINLIAGIPFARKRMLDAAHRAEALIAVSSALATKMIELGMPHDRVHVMRNGVDSDLFAPFPRTDARQRIGLRDDCRWIVGVGNLVAEKGFDLLIRAAAMINDARVLIVGDGPNRASLVSLARSIAPGRVEFRDNVLQHELRYIYAAGDVLGLPSLREGWPNVVLEAIACGTPVVASPVGGVPEILRDDAPGRLVAERVPEAWRDALSDLLDASLPAAQVRRYALRFGWDEVVSQQIALYERVVSAGRSKTSTTTAATRHRAEIP